MKPPAKATAMAVNTISDVETDLNWKYKIKKITSKQSGTTTDKVFSARN
ncbi:hypothetical protein JCM19314_2129 [Nonlabens ulvanivorans]|uniref:Uncharacterized protein n=1 Tax=Nonlabens ulvanivorans TaxID=906888 RepID=A0A090QC60_NONUL|nr:hypothetical protein JCM19314_2129 [Nonlabens ulvanivorans]